MQVLAFGVSGGEFNYPLKQAAFSFVHELGSLSFEGGFCNIKPWWFNIKYFKYDFTLCK